MLELIEFFQKYHFYFPLLVQIYLRNVLCFPVIATREKKKGKVADLHV